MKEQNDNADPAEVSFRASLSLQRIQPKLDQFWEESSACTKLRQEFDRKLQRHWPDLFSRLMQLYGKRWDFFYHLEDLLLKLADSWCQRDDSLKRLDEHRLHDPNWFLSEKMVGAALYVDLFSENLGRLREHIDYFRELGINYLHLMPLFAVRPGNNDGGYAISNYRSIDPRIGTIEELQELARELRQSGICLVLDFVLNHTSDDHEWARRAQAGQREFQKYYYVFETVEQTQEYERTLREIFPTVRRGNFTRNEPMQRYVWTTFNDFLANTGVDILRLDAVAFIWKEKGTPCENLPEAHVLVQAFNAVARIAAPGLLFKSEAIVHPDDVVKYISPEECQISYNPTLMALLWESLATREVKLLKRSLSHRHQLPAGTTWANYLRCHDDIGWTFDDADAAAVGINGYDHRKFLNSFYTGQFDGSFARGIPFQHNEQTGDMRISGTMASLAGLEQGIEEQDGDKIVAAVERIRLLHGITLTIGGIPLMYMGEEWGMLNDYDFVKDPAKAGDTRWIHRPKMEWEFLQSLDEDGVSKQIYASVQRLIAIRKSVRALAGQQMELFDTRNPHVLGYTRSCEGSRLVVIANFADSEQQVDGNLLRTSGLGRFFRDYLTEVTVATSDPVSLFPRQVMWLERV